MTRVEEDVAGAFSVATNSAGAGGIDGIGIGPRGEPGGNKNKKKLRALFPMIKRAAPTGGNTKDDSGRR